LHFYNPFTPSGFDVLEELNKLMITSLKGKFAWQDGYGAFHISFSYKQKCMTYFKQRSIIERKHSKKNTWNS